MHWSFPLADLVAMSNAPKAIAFGQPAYGGVQPNEALSRSEATFQELVDLLSRQQRKRAESLSRLRPEKRDELASPSVISSGVSRHHVTRRHVNHRRRSAQGDLHVAWLR